MIDTRYFYLLFLVIGMAVIFMAIYKSRKQEKNARQNEETAGIRQKLQGETDKYEENVRNLIGEIQSKIDDFEELKRLSARCETYTGGMITDIPALNGLIAYKRNVCRDLNISFQINIRKVAQNIIKEHEMISLIGNLLDNAIEAAAKCLPGKRYIKFESGIVKGRWIIRTENSKLISEAPISNDMATTKEDKEKHGIGTKLVKRIVRRNKGDIKFRDKGECFEAVVILPIK